MRTQPSVAAIILAAGRSSRMEQGYHKLLLPLGDKPVIAHVVEAVLNSHARPCIVVLGHQADQVHAALASYNTNPSLLYIKNPDFALGMSTSLRSGLAALQSIDRDITTRSVEQPSLTIDGAIILLGDQPFVNPALLNALISCHYKTQRRIIAPQHNGKRGTPVLFAASLFPELAQVQGDEGGKSVIARHPTEIEHLEVSKNLSQHDVDTWEAYQQALTQWQHNTHVE